MIKERINKLRELMRKNKIDAYVVLSTDPHASEYVPALWQRRAWLSGFDGSAGDVVVTMKKAGLWTDSRYFLQAEQQLQGTGIDLYKAGLPETPDMLTFLKQELNEGQTVGIDPRVISYQQASQWQKELALRKIKMKFLEENLVDALWEDQPEMPQDPIMVWEDKYAGESVESKLARIRQKMAEKGCQTHVLTQLDAIAWTFNIRSRDVDYNPVVIAYAVITEDEAELFVHKKKVTRALKKHLKGLAKIRHYDSFKKRLLKLARRKTRVWLDGSSVNYWVAMLLQKRCELFLEESPVTLFKAIKNETELAGMRACHIRDGVAMVRFLKWLEENVPQGGVTEMSAAQRLEKFRAEQSLYQGPSFETISAYGEHGAIVHYACSPETDVELKPEGIYLIDSGGQYLDGTTDITRTLALGEPTEEQRDRFTRILKGHIDLAIASFPVGTQGIQLDTLARKALWEIGQNYGHGTGHGVGAFLSVHEGPQGISFYRGIGVPLEVGMVCSNEPGFYKAGEYGMRVENLIVVVKDEQKSSEEWSFLKFENLTYCPIDLKLVDLNLLTREEIDYLNAYHKKVYDILAPYLKKEERQWLKEKTQPV
ncbi:peptidase M24 [Caldithrix abyssi DSM 13497]|uniref:Peptidase M24 n=1 Tax=Caldithrix abyssi DSM 13497 TaxID=880073 RepID=H1XWP0_CALAY|nr:aminopeptidase P family protein [Caldithrix abyssi]APF17807.1 Xaa-Pro aminopeptidase [Caldithrix abyssi DSM 13497]EHO41878.1 peptidase M24 [Caldithrix abyssi DSM 13497]